MTGDPSGTPAPTEPHHGQSPLSSPPARKSLEHRGFEIVAAVRDPSVEGSSPSRARVYPGGAALIPRVPILRTDQRLSRLASSSRSTAGDRVVGYGPSHPARGGNAWLAPHTWAEVDRRRLTGSPVSKRRMERSCSTALECGRPGPPPPCAIGQRPLPRPREKTPLCLERDSRPSRFGARLARLAAGQTTEKATTPPSYLETSARASLARPGAGLLRIEGRVRARPPVCGRLMPPRTGASGGHCRRAMLFGAIPMWGRAASTPAP